MTSLGLFQILLRSFASTTRRNMVKRGTNFPPFQPTLSGKRFCLGQCQKSHQSEIGIWRPFCTYHPELSIAHDMLENVSLFYSRSIRYRYPDLLKHLHKQIRLMTDLGLNGGVPRSTNRTLCCIRKICR